MPAVLRDAKNRNSCRSNQNQSTVQKYLHNLHCRPH